MAPVPRQESASSLSCAGQACLSVPQGGKTGPSTARLLVCLQQLLQAPLLWHPRGR